MSDEAPTDLHELYSRDPLLLTRDDIRALITDLRGRHAQYNLGNMKAGKATRTTKPSKLESLGLNLKLDLSSALKKSIEEGKNAEDKD